MFARKTPNKTEAEIAAPLDNRTLTVRIVAVFATVMLAFMLIGLIFNLVTLGRLQSEKAALTRELTKLEQQIIDADNLLGQVQSDEYLEQLAREQLGMVGGDGELIYTT